VLLTKSKAVNIGKRMIGPGNPTYVIAEIGANHDQDLGLALDMISMAAEAGADAVKFQSIRFDRLYDPAGESSEFREWFRQIELDEAWYPLLADRSRSAGVDFISSPTYIEAIDLLVACHVPALKLASPQVQGNLPLVRMAAATGLPLVLSMGYAAYGDIANALAVCREAGNEQLVLLHCVSKYPAAPSEARLAFMRTLAAMTGYPTGFSDHTLGTHMAAAAVALGACVIEKHVTVDRGRNGPDHHFALTFPEFRSMVMHVREVEAALGDGTRLELLPEELELREKVRLKAIARRAIESGEALEGGVAFLRSGQTGLSPSELGDLARYRAREFISPGTVLQWSDLQLP
jgi:N,N'-diacetyllegionaminate synthase